MDYFEKITKKPDTDLTWNLPEQKRGIIKVVGGNSQNFRAEMKTAEFLANNYPIETVTLVLPDSLKSKLPELPNINYVGATESGSFGDKEALNANMASADYNLILGDLTKNSVTIDVICNALNNLVCPALLTRDTVDLVTEYKPEPILMNPQIVFLASMSQLQKLFRSVYYPKMILLSQSLVQVVEVLHKFTLSYPAKIITLHNEQILIAENGKVKAVPIEKSGYAPITIWSGELAAKIAVMNLFNPNNFLDASVCAIFA